MSKSSKSMRLALNSLDAREMPAVMVPNPMAVATPALVSAPAANNNQVQLKVTTPAASANLAVATNQATTNQITPTPGVTRLPPTRIDLQVTAAIENRKWYIRYQVTNPYTGIRTQITQEMKLLKGGVFSADFQSVAPGFLGLDTKRIISGGKWWVQNNGILVIQTDYSSFPVDKYYFIQVKSVAFDPKSGYNLMHTKEFGAWYQIPWNTTYIR